MAGEVTKQDQALTKGAKLVSEARSELDTEMNGLRNQLSGISSGWVGGGASAFTSVMARWDADTRKIVQALDTFEANLRASEQTYNTSDEDQASTFSRLGSRLG